MLSSILFDNQHPVQLPVRRLASCPVFRPVLTILTVLCYLLLAASRQPSIIMFSAVIEKYSIISSTALGEIAGPLRGHVPSPWVSCPVKAGHENSHLMTVKAARSEPAR